MAHATDDSSLAFCQQLRAFPVELHGDQSGLSRRSPGWKTPKLLLFYYFINRLHFFPSTDRSDLSPNDCDWMKVMINLTFHMLSAWLISTFPRILLFLYHFRDQSVNEVKTKQLQSAWGTHLCLLFCGKVYPLNKHLLHITWLGQFDVYFSFIICVIQSDFLII